MNLSGKWKGVCRYHAAEAETTAAADQPFSLQLAQGWFGRLTGTLCDEIMLGHPEELPLHGKKSGNVVRFTMYRPHRFRTPEKITAMQEYIENNLAKKLDQPLAPCEVNYSGTISDDGIEMAGTWNILHAPIRFLSEGTWYEFDLGGLATTGTWHVRRVGSP